MTFGEHLEELRRSLVRAIIWLGIGLAVGLFFASDVVRFVADPLRVAIAEFHADRALAELGYDPQDEEVQPLQRFLMQNSLAWEIVYEIPDELQALTMEMMHPGAGEIPGGPPGGEDTDGEESGLEQAAEEAAADTPLPDDAAGNPRPAGETSAASGAGEAGQSAQSDQPSQDQGSAELSPEDLSTTVQPEQLAKMLSTLPDPSALKPRVQLRRTETSLSTLKMEEGFMIWIKAGLIVGAVLASPMIFYHLWSFIAAGLHAHERHYVYIYLPFSVTLFISGVVLAFFLVLQFVLDFLLQFNGSMDVSVEPRLTYYVNFVLLLPLGFGVAFQLPLVMLFLQRIGLIETESYIESWKVAVLVIFVISMLVTPADVTSMVALAVPLMLLYFLGILMCKFLPRGRGLGSAAYDPA